MNDDVILLFLFSFNCAKKANQEVCALSMICALILLWTRASKETVIAILLTCGDICTGSSHS